MRKVILSLAIIATSLAFAQKKEISAAVKSVDTGDAAGALAKISEAEAAFGNDTTVLEPSLLEKYYYAKGLALFRTGKVQQGAELLGKIGELGKSKIYVGKNGKQKLYFVGMDAAKQSGLNNLKEETYSPEYASKLGEILNPSLQAANKAAMDAYNAKDYAKAAPKFAEVYNLLKAVGQDNKQYLYYSAITYALAKDHTNAINSYKYLIDSGYTGVETRYLAKNKKTNEVENLDKNSWELLKKAAGGDYTDFKTEVTKSVEEELYETLVGLLSENDRYDEAIVYADKGLKKFPKNVKLNNSKGLAYYKSGKTEEFIASLKQTLEQNPKDKDAWYNLGVMVSKDPAKQEEALGYFKKAVELDPKFANAWQNLVYVTIGDDEKTIEEYNKLRKSGKIEAANKVIEARRKRLAEALPYAEKWYESDPNSIDAVSQLKGLYTSLKNEAKAKEFRAKEESMKK
ncbi:MAG: tetratricopeptide repeat protein [Bergeyella cardium]